MTLRERLKAITNNFACEQDWNIHEYAIRKRDIDYRRGKADAYRDVVHRLDEVLDEFPEEPVGNPDKLTLKELARELRKLFVFKYLTKDPIGDIYCWDGKPVYDVEESFWTSAPRGGVNPVLETWPSSLTVEPLDLSEYADKKGNIDYSKCIVEVTDASE